MTAAEALESALWHLKKSVTAAANMEPERAQLLCDQAIAWGIIAMAIEAGVPIPSEPPATAPASPDQG